LVLATAAIRRPSYILIDEPELSLHASLQSDFLQTLTAYSSEGVVFATHSLGLARTVADTIYSVVRSDGRSRLVPYDATPRLAEFIGAMSFAGKPDLGFDRVLLVEGTTDGRAIQQFLRRLGKDHQVLPIPLGGATLIKGGDETETQLTELKRITPHISALIDSERTSADAALDPSREGFRNLCLRVGVVCHVLERRALENYFTPEAVERALGPGHLELGHFGSLKRGQGGWSKQQNWRIAGEMTLADLKGTDLLDALNAI
jgi:energy-coupling factor transporter ATP-binding protein EcfA2